MATEQQQPSLVVSQEMEKCGPLLWTRMEVIVEKSPSPVVGRVFLNPAETIIQDGPTCGFVALVLAGRAAGLEPDERYQVDLNDVLAWARMVKYTRMGEMFSSDWLARIGNEFFRLGKFQSESFPTQDQVIDVVNGGGVFLVPYDCDKNFEPTNRQGEGAHWAALVGYFTLEPSEALEEVGTPSDSQGAQGPNAKLINFDRLSSSPADEDNFWVVAYQGKSKHPALWKYSVLRESNQQLTVADQKRASSFQLPPKPNPDDIDLHALRGRTVRVSKKE